MKHRLLATDDQRVTGVVSAMEAYDHVGTLGEQIDDLPLSLVSPLRAQDDEGVRRQHRLAAHSWTGCAEVIAGRCRRSFNTGAGTGSSTWKNEIARPLSSRPSSMPAMLIPCLASSIPTAPTTPGTSRLLRMRMCPSGTASM